MNTVDLENISEATGNYLVYNAESENNFDRIAVKMLLAALPPFLAFVKIMNKYDNCVVKYDIGSYRSIQSIKMRMSKKECCTLLYNMLEPMMSCGEWLLDYHKFCFQKDYILCDINTFDVKFIYILDNDYYCSDSDIMDIFRSVFKNTDIIDDKDFRINLLQALLDEDFSINGLYEMIVNIIKKPAAPIAPVQTAQTVKKEPAPAKTHLEKNTAELHQQAPAKVSVKAPVKANVHEAVPLTQADIIGNDGDDDDKMLENLFSNGKKKAPKPPKKEKVKSDIFGGLFGKNKQAKEKNEAAVSETDIQNDKTDIVGLSTDLSDDETQVVSTFLQLENSIFAGCPNVINVAIKEGGSMTIGRRSANAASVNADVELPAECTKISRKHCQIRLENGVYSICDLNSGNGTYVDGKKAGQGEWLSLQNGSRIMLGNEVVVYTMQINA